MSKTQLWSFILFLVLPISLEGQIPKYNPYFFRDSDERAEVAPYRLQQLGTMYFDDTWNAGSIVLQNGDSLIGYFIRFDIIRNSLEIIINRQFHTINKSQIEEFDWFSGERLDAERYVRRDKYNLPPDNYAVDFVELLVEGPLSLIKTTAVVPRQESTSPSLVPDNAKGSDMLIIEKIFFVRGDELFEVTDRKNPNLDFIDHKEVNKYVRDNRMNFSIEGDVKSVVRYFNSVTGD